MMDQVPFRRYEFDSMVGKGKWVVLPYLVAKELSGLRPIHPGVKEEQERQPRWIGDYSYSYINSKSLPTAALSDINYGRKLGCLVGEAVTEDTDLGPI